MECWSDTLHSPQRIPTFLGRSVDLKEPDDVHLSVHVRKFNI